VAELVDALDLGSSELSRESSSLSIRIRSTTKRLVMSDLQVSIKNTTSLGRSLTIIVPAQALEKTHEKKAVELAKRKPIDGFKKPKRHEQPSKELIKIVKKLYRDNLWQETLTETLKSSLMKTLEQHSLNPVQTPEIRIIKASIGEPLEYEASLEILPTFPVPDFKEVTLEKLTVDLTDLDIDAGISMMQLGHAQWVTVDRSSQYQDKVRFEFALPSGQLQSGELVLVKDYIPHRFMQLLNVKPGDVIQLEISKDQSAQATVKEVLEPRLPELNESFIQSCKIQAGTIDALRAHIRDTFAANIEKLQYKRLYEQAVEKLIGLNLISDVPQTLITTQFEFLLKKAREDFNIKGSSELTEQQHQTLMTQARNRAVLFLLCNALIKEYNLEPEMERARFYFQQLAESLQFNQEKMKQLMSDPNFMAQLRYQILQDQVINRLIEQAQYSEMPSTYSQLTTGEFV
jgi:trigger factor